MTGKGRSNSLAPCRVRFPQQQLQLSKQQQIKLQDQGHSYNVMGSLFSSLEYYAKRICKNSYQYPIKFNYYNDFDCGNKKSLDDLKRQIIIHFELFKNSFLGYEVEYGKYDFPPNLPREDVVKILNYWISIVPRDDKKFYSATRDLIINGDTEESFRKELKSLPSTKNKGSKINTFLDATRIASRTQQYGEEISKKYQENPNYRPSLKIGCESGDKTIYRIGIDEEKRDKIIKTIYNLIKEILGKIVMYRQHAKFEKELQELQTVIHQMQSEFSGYVIINFDNIAYNNIIILIEPLKYMNEDICRFGEIINEICGQQNNYR